jgi:quinol monooxygenase YgiN
MKLKSSALGALVGLFAIAVLSGPATAADRPYTEGPVVNVAAIRTEPGMADQYLQYLAGTYKQTMEEQKKAGIILDYAVYRTVPRGPDDPDIYLVTTYKNMAALDGLADKTDPIQQKLVGDQAARNAAMIARGKMRTALGSELLRQLDLK